MDPFAQSHLVELIATARQGPHPSVDDPDEWKQRSLISFNAALAALRGVGAVSAEETEDWTNRILIALGEEPLKPLPSVPGASTFRVFAVGGKHDKRPPRPPDPPPTSRFLALVPVNEPDRPLDYGGRIQILGVELYSDKVAVNWRLAPLPDYDAVFATELAEQERDLEGLPEDYRKILRDKLIHQLQMRKRFLRLTDNVGTAYHPMGVGSGGGSAEKRGHSDFAPAVPTEAQRLMVLWDKEEFDVQLPPDRLAPPNVH